ncbi:unnamed protein product [Cladocopium goreaui]|uniref:Protein-serine/threonine kinase n=1 Tax=Cladocopium goreaui TaxID=2562237 RepID=A0A9P1CH29_9DINO|nr:unnamed protein product [Cladocopium goreaui]
MRQIVTWRNARDMVPTIQKEVPKRFALRIRLIETLDGWQAIPELVKMHDLLTGWYRDLVLLDYKNPDLASFVRSFKSIRDEGRHTIALSASGIYKLRNKLGKFSQQETNFLDEWLDGFLLSRSWVHEVLDCACGREGVPEKIGTNALIDQFIAIASKEDGGLGRPTGITDPRCNASNICRFAAQVSSYMCYQRFGTEPKYIVQDYQAGRVGPQEKSPCYFSLIPSYLRYIMCELLKNSFRATLLTEIDISSRPVHIRVCNDVHHVAILVSDEAGGIPFEVGDQIWSYMYGTAAKIGTVNSFSTEGDELDNPESLTGYGVGLPCARLYARYLGGKLSLTSYPSYGTQAHLILPRLGSPP